MTKPIVKNITSKKTNVYQRHSQSYDQKINIY